MSCEIAEGRTRLAELENPWEDITKFAIRNLLIYDALPIQLDQELNHSPVLIRKCRSCHIRHWRIGIFFKMSLFDPEELLE